MYFEPKDVFNINILLEFSFRWEHKPFHHPFKFNSLQCDIIYSIPMILHVMFYISAPAENKVPVGHIPRNLEDEGFFIGEPAKVSLSTLSKMENRILASDKDVRNLVYLSVACY